MKLLKEAIKLTIYFVALSIFFMILKFAPQYKDYIAIFAIFMFLFGLAFTVDTIVNIYEYIVKKIEEREKNDK